MMRSPTRLLFPLVLLSLLSLPPRAAHAQQLTPLGNCTNGQAENFEIGLVIASETDAVLVTVTNEATGVIEDSRWAYGNQDIDGTGCHWVAHVHGGGTGSDRAHVSGNVPLTIRFEVNGQSGQPESVFNYTYSLCHTDGDLDSFYCPDGAASNGFPDLLFYLDNLGLGGMRVYPVQLGAIGVSYATGDIADYFTDQNWVLPLQIEEVCAAEGYSPCPTILWNDMPFLTPQTEGASYTFSAGVDVVIPPGRTWAWQASDVTEVRFPQGTRLVVEGEVELDGATLTAADSYNGWGGIWFEPGSDGLIEDSFIERVGGWGSQAVRVNGASPTIRNTFIQNPASYSAGVTGIYVTGSTAYPVLEENRILNMSGLGVSLNGGATARLVRNIIQENDGTGFGAGFGTEAFLSPPYGSDPNNSEFGNAIEDNGGDGVSAVSSAYLTLGWYYYGGSGYHADGFNSVVNNGDEGLAASSGGRIAAGNTSNNKRNRLFGNTGNDAESVGTSSRTYARCNWWNDTTPPFRTYEASGGILTDDYWLTQDPYVNPNASCVNSIGGMTYSASDGAFRSASSEAETPRGLLVAAAEVIDIDPEAALLLLGRIVEEVPEDPVAQAALAEASYLLTRPEVSARVQTTAEALLEAAAASARPGLRAGALRALISVHYRRGEQAEAQAAAEALVAEAVSEEDVRFGHVALVYLHAAAGRAAEARTALAEVEARAPGSTEAEMARHHLLGSGMVEEAEARSAAAASAAMVASVESVGIEKPFALVAVRPNPVRGAAVLPFVLAEAARVRITLYDVLGREVTVAADRAFEAGHHEVAFDGSALPAGVYLVRAVFWPEGSAPQVETRRVTNLR